MKKLFITLVLFCPFLLFAGGQTDISAATEPQRTITVSGTGTASAAPDSVQLSFALTVQNADVKVAMDENTRRTNALLSMMAEFEMGQEAITQSNFSIYETYRPGMTTPTEDDKVFEVSNQLGLTLPDIERLSDFLDRLIEVGINQVWNIAFALSDTSALEEEARRLALDTAAAKAENIASYYGKTLGEVVSIQESDTSYQPSLMREVALSGMGSGPVAPGGLSHTESLTVTYRLVD